MNDQAESLRSKLEKARSLNSPKTIAVVSGKGGVGKSNFSLNFSISLSRKGHSVLLFDMDIGMGNLDILMGKTSEYSIADFFDGKASLKNIVMEGPNRLHYIAGGTGLQHLVKLEENLIEKFAEELSNLVKNYEYVIFDMGAGISEESSKFILSVQELFVITTSEPTSITDAYSIMKHIHLLDANIPFYLVINRVHKEKEGLETYKRIANALKQFLGRDSVSLGILPDDRNVQQAVKRQIPFILLNNQSPASKALNSITERYFLQKFDYASAQSSFHFISKLKQFLFER